MFISEPGRSVAENKRVDSGMSYLQASVATLPMRVDATVCHQRFALLVRYHVGLFVRHAELDSLIKRHLPNGKRRPQKLDGFYREDARTKD